MQPLLASLTEHIRLLETDDFWIFCGILIVLSIGGAMLAFWKLNKLRLIQDTPTSKIRSAAQGYVELEGLALALPGEPVTSPLSQHPCIWWKYSIEEKRHSQSHGRSNTRWVTIESDTSHDLFELKDATGNCVVDPEGARVIPNQRLTWYGSTRRPHKRPTRSRIMGLGKYRYREQIIKIGSPLYALGWFRTEGGIAHTFDEKTELRDLLAEWKSDQQSLLKRFDSDGDGQIDLQEWEQVRQAAIEQVRQSQLRRSADPDIHVLCRPPRRMRYILSTLSQDKLVKRARTQAILGVISFFFAGSACVFMASVRGIL